ncbi:hypothetical protein EDD29_7613 [Actinocorallia herbida]|uniref:PT repeat-containing protein n=1 Tax=Actinocorallia herbida TaxID=58109 RepID=A0A3N1D8N0_9ACTN|nr:hypothetical protein [Actinocorallia herbida]ROO89903.1 hypothetical protein EDD29_7613 [Actinocorallia herbida]
MRAKPLALTLLPSLLAALCAAPAFAEETPQTATPGTTAASPAAAPTAETEPSPAPSPSPSSETSPSPSGEASVSPSVEESPTEETTEAAASPSEGAGAGEQAKAAETDVAKDTEAKDACPEVPKDAATVTQEQAAAFYKAWKAADCTVPAADTKAAPADPFTTYTEDVTLTADVLTQTGLTYDGVVTLPTSTGSARLLKFSMSTAKLTGLRQTAGGLTLGAAEFGFSGSVVMYAASITGKAFGLLPMTLTPDAPPPLVLPVMMFTDVTVTGTAVTAAKATVSGLDQR